MLGNLRISSKLMIMVGLSVAGIVAVAAVGLMALRNNLMEDRKDKLQQIVQVVRQALDVDRENAKKAGLSEADTLARSKALLGTFRFNAGDYLFAMDLKGIMQVHPNPKFVGQADDKTEEARERVRNLIEISRTGGFLTYSYPRPGGDVPLPKISYTTSYAPYGWVMGASMYVDDIDGIFWAQVWKIGALIALALALVAGLSVALGRSVVKPITAMTAAMRKLAGGDTGTAIPARERGDEVGAMAQSVQVFKEMMLEAARLRQEQDTLKVRSEAEKKNLMQQMADEFEQGVRASLDTLAQSATGMRSMSQGMSATAEEASQQSATVAAAAEQATANVQTVASATEELSSSVAEIGRQVTRSTEVAGQAVREAERTNHTVQGLSAAATKIGDVVKLISDIASQTNLLALNATIEAARAGEAGRGFAVVASEVKSLASQTAKATEEIAAQVAAMQDATADAVQAIESIGGTISSINEITTTIASAVEEQGAATREIARNVQQAAQGTGQVSQNIVGVNEAASQTGAAAGEVLASAEDLGRHAAALGADIERFLAGIRAA